MTSRPLGQTRNQRVLAEYLSRFPRETRYGGDLLRLIEVSEVKVVRCVPDSAGKWFLNLVLPEHAAAMFDTHLEVLCVYTEFGHVEPRILSVIQQQMRDDVRVEPEFAIIVSQDPDLENLVARRRGELAVLTLQGTGLKDPGGDLRTLIAKVLTSLDHYDFTFPVTEPSGFFGRRHELDSLNFSLDRGQPVGIFGLRKAGKTSLLNYVQRQRTNAGKPIVRLDMSEVSSGDEFRLELLKRAFKVAQSRFEVSPKLRLLTRDGSYRSTDPNIPLHWIEDLVKVLDRLDARLEVVVDEIDQAYPERSSLGGDEARSIFTAVTQLRGLIQRRDSANSASLVLLCAGVDPAIFEKPIIERKDNLLYKLVRLQFLAPMGRDEMAEMVRSLGKRMGLRYRDYHVIDYLFEEYGGHPLLTRKACSLASRRRPPLEIPWNVPLESIQGAAQQRGPDTPAEQASDVLDSFQEWFPGEAELLRLLWSIDPSDNSVALELLADDSAAGEHIFAYGLSYEDWSPRIRALQQFVQA